jgi:DNA polymerase-1
MSLAFRAFYALDPSIATSEGVVTNALHGFASMLNTLIKTHTPRALVVAFDLPGGSFRDAMADDYKGGRAETPVEIEHQFDLIRDLCAALAIPVIGVPGFEADDVLATLATWGRDHHIPTIVVTGDRDSFQLVEDPYVRVLYNKRGVSDYDLYDEAGILARCGVEPQRYPLYAALRGDPSDNLPGVPGVGEKTAAKLLQTYRDFDELFRHADDQTPKLRENLKASEGLARNNLEVMRLVRTVPIDVAPEEFHLGGWDQASITAFFDRFEMNSMKQRWLRLVGEGLLGEPGTVSDSGEAPVVVQGPSLEIGGSLADVTSLSAVVIHRAGDRVALCSRHGQHVVVGQWNEIAPHLAGCEIFGHDVKEVLRDLNDRSITTSSPGADTAIAAYLLDSAVGSYDLASVSSRYGAVSSASREQSLFDDNSSDESLLQDLRAVRHLIDVLEPEISRFTLDKVYREIELPLVAVLARMESLGIAVDRERLLSISEGFSSEVERLDAEIQQVAGHPFKVNSPAQLQTVLFEELGLTPTKKIKSGYSTDAASLEAIEHEHPIVPLILRFREVDKLRGTYGASLLSTIRDDGRIHATFHQTVARTGRLSSESPNLHNIPVRSEEGRKLRTAFVPREGCSLLVSDYNQIELRILAHLSQDSGLLAAFSAGTDVHTQIASVVFGVDSDDVTKEQRERAKAVSYGLAYGMEAFGLSQRLGVSVSEAKSIMDQYFNGFPNLRAYMDEAINEARVNGFSRTEFGRIRPFPDLMTASGPQRAAAERQAMNAGIQGLAADIFKLALVRLDEELIQAGLEARIVLQVHDEVLVEAPDAERLQVEAVVRNALTQAATLSVPLEISLAWGADWASAKG